MEVLVYVVTALAAYLLGSIPTGYLVARAKGIDIRTVGSGNIGATNAFRVLGKAAGTFVLLADAAKGFLACGLVVNVIYLLLGKPAHLPDSSREYLKMVAGVCAILGHNYTCFLRFKGGKGIATSAGVFFALTPLAFTVALITWIVFFYATRYVSVASIAAAVALPVATWLTEPNPILDILTAAIGALAIYKHKANIQRLIAGTENRIGKKPAPPKPPDKKPDPADSSKSPGKDTEPPDSPTPP